MPWFLGAVLLVWTLTVLSSVRQIYNKLLRFTCGVKTVPSCAAELIKDQDSTVHLVGLPLCLKITLALTVQLPRLVMIGYLWWMGCRFLVATMSWTDLLLNALALE